MSDLVERAREVSRDMRVRAIIPGNPAEQAADVIDELIEALEARSSEGTD